MASIPSLSQLWRVDDDPSSGRRSLEGLDSRRTLGYEIRYSAHPLYFNNLDCLQLFPPVSAIYGGLRNTQRTRVPDQVLAVARAFTALFLRSDA